MKKFITLLLVLVIVLSVVACSKSTDKQEGSDGEGSSDLPFVGGTIYKYDDNFMSFVRRSLEANADGKITLELNDSQNDQAKQNEQIDNFIAKSPKALVINLVNPQAAATVIEKVKSKEIPVVFFNKEPDKADLESYDKAYYVGTTSAESGVMEGEIIAESWKANPDWDKNKDGKIQYVLLKGEPGHPDAEARTEFSIKTVNEMGIETEELALDTAMWNTTTAKEKMDAWLSKYNDEIEYVICNNDAMALGALTSLEANGYFKDDKFMPIVGVDAIPDALTKIKEGKLVGSVLNDAANQGKATIDLAVNLANGKDPLEGTDWELVDKAVRVPYKKITEENVDEAAKSYEE